MRNPLLLLTIGAAIAFVAAAVLVLSRSSSTLEATDAMPAADRFRRWRHGRQAE